MVESPFIPYGGWPHTMKEDRLFGTEADDAHIGA